MLPVERQQQVIRDNWGRVQEQVQSACLEAGRGTDEVTIVGVTKYVGPELARELAQAGCQVLGENRPQSLWEKVDYFAQHPGLSTRWHLIGHLQRNKVKRTLPLIECMHSLDSLRLAETLSQEADKARRELRALVEVNVTRDSSKTGMSPDQVLELLDQSERLPGLQFSGLMAMSSHQAGSDEVRREFAAVRQLRDDLGQRYPQLNLTDLSMGMSGDFREAILEGATMVRIGSNLWEGLLADA